MRRLLVLVFGVGLLLTSGVLVGGPSVAQEVGDGECTAGYDVEPPPDGDGYDDCTGEALGNAALRAAWDGGGGWSWKGSLKGTDATLTVYMQRKPVFTLLIHPGIGPYSPLKQALVSLSEAVSNFEFDMQIPGVLVVTKVSATQIAGFAKSRP